MDVKHKASVKLAIWDDVRERVRQVNPILFSVIEDLSPNKSLTVFIGKDKVFLEDFISMLIKDAGKQICYRLIFSCHPHQNNLIYLLNIYLPVFWFVNFSFRNNIG